MASRVQIDRRCRIDVGVRTAERLLIIHEEIRAIVELLKTHKGRPPGSFAATELSQTDFVWEDQNWRVGYTLETQRRFPFRTARIITIRTILLKRVRH